jgi:hypothetical protein
MPKILSAWVRRGGSRNSGFCRLPAAVTHDRNIPKKAGFCLCLTREDPGFLPHPTAMPQTAFSFLSPTKVILRVIIEYPYPEVSE